MAVSIDIFCLLSMHATYFAHLKLLHLTTIGMKTTYNLTMIKQNIMSMVINKYTELGMSNLKEKDQSQMLQYNIKTGAQISTGFENGSIGAKCESLDFCDHSGELVGCVT